MHQSSSSPQVILAGGDVILHNVGMSAPLIEFTQFAHPQKWWLRRGPPPWLDDPCWWVRAFRASLFLGLLGTVTGWITVGGLFASSFAVDLFNMRSRWTMEVEFGLFVSPGLWFAIGVLIPLSRWLGRGWVFSLLSVPVSMFACYCGVMTLLLVDPIMAPSPDWAPFDDSGWFFAGLVGAAIVSVWMGNPLQKSAWLAGFAATVLAAIGCGVLPWIAENNPPWLSQSQELMKFAGPYVVFQSLTAVGLGARLWWDRPFMQQETSS